MKLTLFDLDHTLLDGDHDVLWCEFLIARGLADAAELSARNAAMERAYRAGTVGTRAFSEFYIGTLAGRTPHEWEPLRTAFLHEVVAPRIPPAAHALLQSEFASAALVVLSTATNRFLTELTARHLGAEHLIATECERDDAGRFTGRAEGTLNMRGGKVERLAAWLATRGLELDALDSRFYSDSINDLPLLERVRHPVVVDPDPQLGAIAAARGWRSISLHRRAPPAAPG